jgi:hypothetical protein
LPFEFSRHEADIRRSDIREFVLERIVGRQRLTVVHGVERLEFGACLKDPEREWLYSVLQTWHTPEEPRKVHETPLPVSGIGPDLVAHQGQPAEIPATPISSGASFTSHTPLPRVEGGSLVIDPDRTARALGAICLVWGVPAIVASIFAVRFEAEGTLQFILIAHAVLAPAIGVFCILFPVRHEFDTKDAVHRRVAPFRSRSRPLSEILAVQAIRGRPSRDSDTGVDRPTYELNLVLDARGLQRESLSCCGDREWTIEAGRVLSDYLGVPFFCRLGGFL